MSISELYTKDAKVWLPDPVNVWKFATLAEDYTGQKELRLHSEATGQEEKIQIKSPDQLPHLRNPEILIGENDLTSLSYLHEPAVLYNLQVRFCERNYIYTYCGIVLVAINPYTQLDIYDNDTIRAYCGQDMASMDPHIFAVAEEAFKRVFRFEENQSVIVSGESGAGKTVSAKYAMRYFATVCGAESETSVEKRVLASNPIMEAIGNAKTTRNDNSSRFGKYIQILFSKNQQIMGANMRTYLLEKSRVVFQAPEERNYHIFYQLCSAADNDDFKEFKLSNADDFYYTSQGGSPVVASIDDADDFINTRQALTMLGINALKQMNIFRILAGILHLGNVEVKMDDKTPDLCVIPKSDKHMPLIAKLLGIDQGQMTYWLCNKKITTANEVLVIPLTMAQVHFARDALAKHIYSQLFLWIVTELNKSLSTSGKTSNFIGVLDIYGFETFEINSFEQFCINYANEKLQQQFCLHVFKLEQEEYVREQIEWSFIDFYDNQPCIDLIEEKLGILDLLDEECKMPNGSDENWCQKLYAKHSKNKHFDKPRMSRVAFIVRHFADNVEYQIEGFIEKNRDTLLEEHINILKASEYELLAELFNEKPAETAAPAKPLPGGRAPVVRAAREQPKSSQQSKQHRRTVGSQFHDSLNLLMETLFATTPHYVRCIKPNDHKTSFTFDPIRAVQQLRACGVLETVRISAAGYPSRWTYADFFKRYRVLALSKDIVRNDLRKTCENVLAKLISDRDKYQFGKTKMFFRAGQVAYLEKLRSDRLRTCSIVIQKRVRGWLAKRRYAKLKRTALRVQTFGRGLLARRHAMFLRKTHASTVIRAAWLRYRQRQKYLRMRKCIVYIQSYARALIGRHRFIAARTERKVACIQRCVRGWSARRQFKRVMRGIVLLQAHVRRRIARRQLKQLKIEARSVEHMKNVAKGLENKIIELQQKLDEKAKEVSVLREDQLQVIELKNELSKLRTAQQSSKLSAGRLEELELLVAQLTEQLETEKKDKEKLTADKEMIRKEKDEIIGSLTQENIWLKSQLQEVNVHLQQRDNDQEGLLKQRVEETSAALRQEYESERVHHQKLVRDYSRLQQRLENLQNDMRLNLTPGGGSFLSRSPSNVSNVSVESEGSGEKNDADPGYGTTRRKMRERDALNGVNFEKQSSMNTNESMTGDQTHHTPPSPPPLLEKKDISLMTRLQNRIRDLERDKARLRLELDRRDLSAQIYNGSTAGHSEMEIFEAYKVQELEVENCRIKSELAQLQKAVAEGSNSFDMKGIKTKVAAAQLLDQYEAMREEVKQRQNECVRLRTLLATKMSELSRASTESFGVDSNLANEDGELEMAYKTQRELNSLLEKELQRLQQASEQRQTDLTKQIDQLKVEMEKQIKLNSQNLSASPEARLEATLQLEISRLLAENLDIHDMNDKLQESVKNLRRALKIYMKRLKSTDVSDANAELEREMAADVEGLPVVKHYMRECNGMFVYRSEDEQLLVKNLIIDLRPQVMAQHMAGLPANIIFMCMRHTDYMNDDEKVRSLLTNAINGIKKVVKKRQEDPETIAAWLSNTCRLLNNLKQYSGEKTFQAENTSKQNEQCLRNFDLTEYRQILNDLGVWIYQQFIKQIEAQIQAIIVGAVLENEAISGLTTAKQSGLRRTSSKSPGQEEQPIFTPEVLTKTLDEIMKVLVTHSVDADLIRQLFKQLFYFICANALNNLLLRKDMCHWMKGMQIRYNLSQLEQWLRDNHLGDGGIQEVLEPIIQATQLLQARKTDSDVESICEMCTKLTMSQVIKILNLYTPMNEFEERVPNSFIRKIQERLASSKGSTQSLLMDTKFVYAVSFEFNASSVALETINAPTEWGLGFLQKI